MIRVRVLISRVRKVLLRRLRRLSLGLKVRRLEGLRYCGSRLLCSVSILIDVNSNVVNND